MRIIKTFSLILFSIFILSGCSAERRLHRLIALHPELVKNDTIHIQDTAFIPETKVDTIVHYSTLRDTITITKEKLHVKIHQVRDTVYIAAHQDPDTIIITKEIPVEKVIHIQPESITDKIWGTFKYNFLLSILCVVVLIAFIFGRTRR
ncbi:MAG: hypothetical protein C0594_04455 [Marinilabiliales bacterium]|nr:MAG: hypothetical protein C0594_04455 [Marinilabiliales bacterium]